MSRAVHPGQIEIRLCECGSLHVGPCELEYARYGIGSIDRHAARPRRARTPKICDCAFTSYESGQDNMLRRCGRSMEPGEIYVEMPRSHGIYDARLPSWTVSLECAVKYHSDLIRIGLDPDAKIGTLGRDEEEQESSAA